MFIKYHSPLFILLCMNLSSTEPNSYVKPLHHGLMRPTQQIMYNNPYQPQHMMPSTSASPAPSFNQGQWASPSLHFSPASSNPGASNGVGMSQVNPVNPVPCLSTTGESGNSLPLLSSMDLEFLDTQGASANQPQQEQLEHSVQHSQQPLHRKETMPAGENIWHNLELSQAPGTQNGPANTGMMGINYTYSDSQDGNEIFNRVVGPQTGLHLKQEPQAQSTLAMLDPNNSTLFECTESYSMLNYPPTSSSNQEAMRHAASSGASGSGQRNTQNPSYSLTSMVQEAHLDTLNWSYNQYGGE